MLTSDWREIHSAAACWASRVSVCACAFDKSTLQYSYNIPLMTCSMSVEPSDGFILTLIYFCDFLFFFVLLYGPAGCYFAKIRTCI